MRLPFFKYQTIITLVIICIFSGQTQVTAQENLEATDSAQQTTHLTNKSNKKYQIYKSELIRFRYPSIWEKTHDSSNEYGTILYINKFNNEGNEAEMVLTTRQSSEIIFLAEPESILKYITERTAVRFSTSTPIKHTTKIKIHEKKQKVYSAVGILHNNSGSTRNAEVFWFTIDDRTYILRHSVPGKTNKPYSRHKEFKQILRSIQIP